MADVWACQSVSKPVDEAADHFGWLTALLSSDNTVSSALTRERLNWDPVQPGLLTDLDQPHSFEI